MANEKRIPVREQDGKIRAANYEEVSYGYNAEEAAEEALAMIAGGDTLDGAIRLVCFEDAPAVDLDLYFLGVEIDRYGG